MYKRQDKDRFIKFAEEENLEATPVAVVTDTRRLVLNWRGKAVVDISRDFLDTNGVKQRTDVEVKMPEGTPYFEKTCVDSALIESDLKQAWLNNLSNLNVASQKGLVERFDSTIGAGTVLMPFGGKKQLTPCLLYTSCPYCGSEINEDFEYCPKCGKKL